MEQQEEFEIPRKVAHLAAMVKGSGDTKIKGVARPVILRLPEGTLAELDALATMSGKSRNSMAIHLMDAAIEELRSTLDAETLGKLNLATIQNHVAMESNVADREQGEF